VIEKIVNERSTGRLTRLRLAKTSACIALYCRIQRCKKTAEPIEMPFGKLTCGRKEPCVRWGRDPPWGWAILEVVWTTTEQHWESVLRCMQQKGSFNSQKQQLIPKNGRLQCSDWPVSHYIVLHEKCALCNAALRQHSLTRCVLMCAWRAGKAGLSRCPWP